MKRISNATTLVLAGLLASAVPSAVAQVRPPPTQQPPDSVVAVVADAMSLPFVPPDQRPVFGTFWEVRGSLPCLTAPLPFPPLDTNAPVYAIGDPVAGGQFLVDETAGQITSPQAQSSRRTLRSMDSASILQAQVAELQNFVAQVQERQTNAQLLASEQMSPLTRRSLGGGGAFGPMDVSYTAADLWLEITNVSNGFSYYNLHNATNLVYAILTTTNVLTPFAPELEVWPTDTNSQPFSLRNNDRQYLFVRAEDWSGVDSDGDGVPDWWTWKYFGTVSITSTNLDLSGNGCTFAQDFSNNITPTVFKYTGLEVPNNYVSSSQPAVQMDVAGTPYYIALLIDDNSFTNAVWNTYSGSTVTVNLGSVQGWHEVWIGLRAHADDPTSAVWQRKRLKLDSTPPALFITSPTNTTVDIPMIQLQGFSPEALSSISYDLTNAAGLVTNQQVLVLNQYYDTTTWEFTTNTWQAFDVELTNGVNTFTFHATDLAGNTTTASYTVTLDCSAKTNAPSVQVTWPQAGTEISGSRFTLDGQVGDATITVAATITDNNGSTNTVNGVVERTGKFWVENLPLSSGTNTVTLNVTDAVDNTATTSFNVVQSAVTLTINPVSDPQQLWQPTVSLTGTISDASYAIWVNGVKGHNNGDGTWSASHVPVNGGGTASFTATGYAPNEQQPDGSYGN